MLKSSIALRIPRRILLCFLTGMLITAQALATASIPYVSGNPDAWPSDGSPGYDNSEPAILLADNLAEFDEMIIMNIGLTHEGNLPSCASVVIPGGYRIATGGCFPVAEAVPEFAGSSTSPATLYGSEDVMEDGPPAGDSLSKKEKKKINLKDTLDHNLDLSDYLINMHGFVPWPVIISEPALGSFGIAMALVFVSPKKSAKGADQFRFPDITGVAGMYTVNNTWGGGAMRQGSIPKIGMRYTVGLGYVDAKMDFYRESKYFGEIKYQFNLKPIVLAVDLSENLWKNKLFLGVRYEFARMRIAYDTPNIPDSIYDKNTFDKNIGNLGLYAEWDSRNTLFTPDKGVRLKASAGIGRSWTGSSFDFERYEAFTNIFIQPVKPWVCGLRVDFQAVGGTVPFYYYPYVDMRGIAMMRYQGQQVLVIETEQRFDITRRWSVLGFVGTGKTFSNQRFMEDKDWHWAGGAGFRYLLARLFRMRMGIDIAAGPDQFAYYIVLGHYWNR